MGAYLNRPVVEKEKEEGVGGGFSYACTTMQGWRANQEDAHNCVVDLHEGWHMFAVYDGHGGMEVSKFVADKFPDFLKTKQFWETENIEDCLKNAFVDFDDYIRSEDAMKALKDICFLGKKKKPLPAIDSQDEADRIDTIEESHIPLQELIQRYGSAGGGIGRSLLSAFLSRGTEDEDDDDDDEDEEEEEAAEGEEKEEGDGDADKTDAEAADKEGEDEEKKDDVSAGGDKKKVKKRVNKSPIQSDAKKSKPENADAEEESKEEADQSTVSASSSTVKADGIEVEDEEDDSDQDFVADEDEAEDEQSDEEIETDLSQFVLGAGGAETPGEDSGTTACVCLVGGGKIVVANAGDSRAVLCRAGKAVDLSVDHKPEDEVETTRIHAAGGTIEEGRVNGGLNLSRALGDHAYKKNNSLPLKDQMITALPDIKIEALSPDDEFVIVACDGIWNSMESQQVVDFAKKLLAEGKTSAEVCDALCDECLADSTDGDGTGCDNMTVICAVFQR